MFAVLKAGAKLGAKAAKPMFKAVAKSGKTYAKQAARDISNDLKNNARQLSANTKTMATNYLDSQKRRIYQTNRGAIYTNTSGGNRNYNPKPSYYNKPGSNVVKSIY
jgi:hypothetical protein